MRRLLITVTIFLLFSTVSLPVRVCKRLLIEYPVDTSRPPERHIDCLQVTFTTVFMSWIQHTGSFLQDSRLNSER